MHQMQEVSLALDMLTYRVVTERCDTVSDTVRDTM